MVVRVHVWMRFMVGSHAALHEGTHTHTHMLGFVQSDLCLVGSGSVQISTLKSGVVWFIFWCSLVSFS